MIALPFLAGRTVVVLGLGASGLPTAQALRQSGVRVCAWDDAVVARDPAAAAGIPIADPATLDWSAVALLVISPGIPHTHPQPHPAASIARAAGVPIVCDIDLLAVAAPEARFLGITGTNGKSTTTALAGHLLQHAGRTVAVGGNIGVAALTLPLLGARGIYVLELSSYQLELVPSFTADVAVLLNITPDHLARHGGFPGYVAAKRRVFDRQQLPQTAVVAVDDAHTRAIASELEAARRMRVVRVSAASTQPGGVYVADGVLIDALDGAARTVVDLRPVRTLQGRHNWQNAGAAYAAGRVLGVPSDALAEGLACYPGLAHRQELVAVIDGIAFVNDSKATNADAAAKALDAFEPIYWIAGGRAKEGGIDSLGPWFPRIAKAYLIGEAEAAFAVTLEGRLPYRRCGTLEQAVAAAHADARAERRAGATVLLAPACASWDQFRSFEHRGAVFRSLVEALPGGRDHTV